MNLGQLIATLGVDTTGLSMASQAMMKYEAQVQTSVARINARLASTGTVMKTIGKNMTKYLTLPLLAVGAASIKMYADFEASLSQVEGLVGIAHKQVAAWGEDILKMAPKLGKAPKELSDALFFVTSAGIRGAAAMEVLVMSAKASAAGLGETKVVADLVTSAMNAYGPALIDAAKATNVLVATVREGKAPAADLAQSMGMVLPLASEMEVTFNQVGSAIAAMTRTGTGASTASMQLRQILASLKKPTDQAEEALGAMGTSSQALRDVIKREGLFAALLDIKNLTKEYGETVVAKVIPNIRALSGFLDVMGKNVGDNAKIFKTMEDSHLRLLPIQLSLNSM